MRQGRQSKWWEFLLIPGAAMLLVLVLPGSKKAGGTGSAGSAAASELASANLAPSDLSAGAADDMCTWPTDPASEADDSIPPSAKGGDLDPVRYVMDPYPTFNGVALDVANNRVFFSDENRKSVLAYERTAGSNSTGVTPNLTQVIGPDTQLGYIAGVAVDPARHEFYAVNNDVEDRVAVFGYDANGDLKPKRHLYTPHQAWGISFNFDLDQMVISVQQLDLVAFYRREASGIEAPLRIIQGPNTGMADPHGVEWDAVNHEIIVANHGNSAVIAPYSAYDAGTTAPAMAVGGKFLLPSVSVYKDDAKGDVKPLRTIEGASTRLNWPMGVAVDTANNEVAVANNGDNSVLIFGRTAKGNVAPLRVIRGARTGISSPMAVVIDTKNNELWVANYGDHTALVFARDANGDAAPKRIIRNAPAHTPTGGFGNPYAVAYDSKRDELLVPNCVSQPRIAIYKRSASGNFNPVRIIAGQATHLSRTMHGIAYDVTHDEVVVPVALAAAVLTFNGAANGSDAPTRVIQGQKTQMIRPHTLAVDEKNGEIVVGDPSGRDLLVFDRAANGNVAPKRVIQGSKTGLNFIVGVAVDPVHDRIVASSASSVPGGKTGLFIFDRLANGNVAPLGVIAGPNTGIVRPWQLASDPERGKIYVAAINNESHPPYDLEKPRPDVKNDTELPLPWNSGALGFIGVWDVNDNGDVPPRGIIKGESTFLVHPAGVAINPKDGEVYATDSVRNGLFTFLAPYFFTNWDNTDKESPASRYKQY